MFASFASKGKLWPISTFFSKTPFLTSSKVIISFCLGLLSSGREKNISSAFCTIQTVVGIMSIDVIPVDIMIVHGHFVCTPGNVCDDNPWFYSLTFSTQSSIRTFILTILKPLLLTSFLRFFPHN